MTSEEAKDFLNTALVAFPGVNQWLKTASPDAEATKVIWARTLEQITAEEGFGVLTRWAAGTLPAPAGYEKENFVLHIRDVVMRDRSESRRTESREQVLRNHKRTSAFRHIPILGPYMANVMRIKNQYDAGTITA